MERELTGNAFAAAIIAAYEASPEYAAQQEKTAEEIRSYYECYSPSMGS